MKKILKSFRVCLLFLENWFCMHWLNLAFLSCLPIFNDSEDSSYSLFRFQNKFIINSNVARNVLKSFKVFFSCPQKWFCIAEPNFTQKIWFSLLAQGKRKLRNWKYREKIFGNISRLASLSQKNGLYLANKFGFLSVVTIFNHSEDSI